MKEVKGPKPFCEETYDEWLRKKNLGKQLVSYAKERNWAEVAKLISQGASLRESYPDGKQRCAIHFAIMQDNFEALKELCEADKNIPKNFYESSMLDSCFDIEGNSALHYCVIYDMGEFSEYLLKEQRAKAYVQNLKGDTPLHMAIKDDKIGFALFLSQFNMDSGIFVLKDPANMSHNRKDKNGNTPLHSATIKAKEEACKTKKTKKGGRQFSPGWKEVAKSLKIHGAIDSTEKPIPKPEKSKKRWTFL